MKIGVLGPLTMQGDEVSCVLTAPKPRKILALLLVCANQIVSTTVLIEELWGDESPISALTTLQTYISQLRRTLCHVLQMTSLQVAKEVLVTKADGYVFRVRHDELDLYKFEQLAEDGRRALGGGETDRAAQLLRVALELWRGPPLVDVQAGRRLEVEIIRLEQSRLSTLEQRIEAEMRLGRHHELLSELTSLVAQHRLHEDLHAQLMLALYRSGRRSCALETFRRLRHVLIEELGLEPSAKLQLLQQAILSSDPALDSPPHASVGYYWISFR